METAITNFFKTRLGWEVKVDFTSRSQAETLLKETCLKQGIKYRGLLIDGGHKNAPIAEIVKYSKIAASYSPNVYTIFYKGFEHTISASSLEGLDAKLWSDRLPAQRSLLFTMSSRYMANEDFLESLSETESLKLQLVCARVEKNYEIRERKNLEKAVVSVFGDDLKGVQDQTKINNLNKKYAKKLAKEARKAAREKAKKEAAAQAREAAEAKEDLELLKGKHLVDVSTAPTERINDCGTPFTPGTYYGCGKYWVAVGTDGLIKASAKMDCPYGINDFTNFRNYVKKELAKYGTVVSGEGSGTQFFCKYENDLKHFEGGEIYDVPAPNGDGSNGFVHTNFQAV